jgi:stage II sporulation protein GA (sporulation sigma-E factor processing peptidase)
LYLEVYPDIIFILNFFIDFILLFLLKRVNRKRSNVPRLIGAAAIGATFAVVISIVPWMNVIVRFIIMNLIAAMLMLRIAFGKLEKSDLLKQVIVLYLITYFVGGLMNSIYYHTNFRLYLMKMGDTLIFSNISWKFVIVLMLLLVPVILFILWLLRCYQNNVRETYEVELFLENRSVHTKGLMDTGNCLYDPIYKKPVMVIENSLLEELLSTEFRKDLKSAKYYMEGNDFNIGQWDIGCEHLLRLRFVPYQSIGKSQGMMLGLLLDKVLIHTGKETICNEKVTAAICDNHLSTKDDYHVILHKELL